MVPIPAADFLFQVEGIEIEGSNTLGVDVQYPWEDSPRRYHHHNIHIQSFFLDRYPVTNAQFKKFLDTTHYRPADEHNFLKDWKDGNYPQGWDNRPATGFRLKMLEPMRHGRGSACPMNGNGNTRRMGSICSWLQAWIALVQWDFDARKMRSRVCLRWVQFLLDASKTTDFTGVVKVVELVGIEPTASSLRTTRSPS